MIGDSVDWDRRQNLSTETDLRGIQMPPLRQLLKRLARAPYGVASSSGTPSQFVRDFLTDCRWGARTGRVVDVGTMDYRASKRAAQSGLEMLLGGHFGMPFDTTWCATGCTSFTPRDHPERCVTFYRPEDDVFAEFFISAESHVVAWYVVHVEPDGTAAEIIDDTKHLHPKADSYVAAFNTMLAAVAICNTRGVPFTKEEPVKRRGKEVAGVYRFRTGEYFTAIGQSSPRSTGPTGRRSPIPHVRRAHIRHMADGTERWIHEALVNVRSEHELAFTETKRVAYVSGGRARQ